MIKADEFRGKRVQLSGYIKTANGAEGFLWIRVDGGNGMLDLANGISSETAKTHVVRSGSDWTATSQVVDIPAGAIGIAFGVSAHGFGDVWADDLKLEPVGSEVPVSGIGPAEAERRSATEQNRAKNVADLKKRYETASLQPKNLDFEERRK